MKKIIKYQCPVCNNYTLRSKNECDICTVCGWEDDGNERFPDEEFGPNHISFNEAKRLWTNNKEFKKDSLIIRQPLGIELPKDSKEYLNIKKYLDDPENSFKEANKALDYEINHSIIDSTNYLEAKNKAFTIFDALAFIDSEIGKKSAIRLALCYANGYGCKANLYTATCLIEDAEDLYNSPLSNVSIQHLNDKDLITIKISDKTNPKYLKVITDLLSKKLDTSKYESIKCEVISDNSISIEVGRNLYNDENKFLKDVKKIFYDFLKIKTVLVDPKVFKNPHEGITYFNGAQSVLKAYYKKKGAI